ncbi:MAG: hypothetical protein FJY75_00835 [Candidatus Eisenbacteria bacterium]|uniref:Uncharacterized protein n=1 Tax=Eiseniibacteriota bacterium TaxID=2212470 RepID=A0A937X979_UNCEI|nr:hypothetical protein [Candidatus Eisenbacteria bacterium]
MSDGTDSDRGPIARPAALCALIGPFAAIVGSLAAIVVPGCLVDERPYPANRPPKTYLAIQGDTLQVANYRTILHWWGTDADGRVIGYAYRWSDPWRPAAGDSLWWEDPRWTFTTATRDTFDVPVRGAYAERLFQVRAIDDGLAADPTPAAQRFRLSNAPPVVRWTDTRRHPTHARPSLPAISFAWTPEDYDGRETIAYARLWLDLAAGEDSAASTIVVAPDTVGAFFPEHFQGRHGQRTVFLQVFDRAETGSDTISWSWTVVPPAGEYLLIDTAWPASEAAAVNQDLFWRARLDAFAPGNYHIYDMETEGPFRSAQEVLPLFSLFKGVVWYGIKWHAASGAPDGAMLEALRLARDALLPYAAAGHGVLISGHNLIGTAGAFPAAWLREPFGIEEIHTYYDARVDVWISDFELPRFAVVRCGAPFGGTDSLVVSRRVPSTDYFRMSPGRDPLLWLEPGSSPTLLSVFPRHATETFCLGAVADTGAGRVALVSTLLTDFAPVPSPAAAVEALLRDLLSAP